MFCENCGVEGFGKFCSNCGAPMQQSTVKEDDYEYSLEPIEEDCLPDISSDRYYATKKIGVIKIDEDNNMFQINGVIPQKGKGGFLKNTLRGVMAVSTVGLSLVAEKAVKGAMNISQRKWLPFEDLIRYELIEDDSMVTKGGVGMALVGGAIFGGFGAVAGGLVGKRVQKKRVDSLIIQVTLNSFDCPCVIIPLITKPTKTNSKDYQYAVQEAYKMMSALDVITHNKY